MIAFIVKICIDAAIATAIPVYGGGTLTISLESLIKRGVFDDRDDEPSYITIHTKRKASFRVPQASLLFTTDEISDYVAKARGRIITVFASHATLHRNKYKPTGYIIGVSDKLCTLVDYVVEQQGNRPLVETRDLPEDMRKLTSGKQRQVIESLTREFIGLAMQPLYKAQDIWFMCQNGGEWHIAAHCLDELPRAVSTRKRKTVGEASAA